jgi:hypothetical protein
MNPRIKQLAEQARNYALDEKRIYERMNNTEQCMEEYREVYNKKFAELIVQECARVARATPFPDTDVEVRKTFGHTWDMASVEAGREIVKHFGVEE